MTHTEIIPSEHTPPNQGPEQKARDLATLCHLLGFCGFFIPLGNIVVPLLLWLFRKDRFSFVDQSGRNILNFQISWILYSLLTCILIFVFMGVWMIFVGLFLIIVLAIAWVILMIVGGVKAQKGILYRYPLTIRFL